MDLDRPAGGSGHDNIDNSVLVPYVDSPANTVEKHRSEAGVDRGIALYARSLHAGVAVANCQGTRILYVNQTETGAYSRAAGHVGNIHGPVACSNIRSATDVTDIHLPERAVHPHRSRSV